MTQNVNAKLADLSTVLEKVEAEDRTIREGLMLVGSELAKACQVVGIWAESKVVTLETWYEGEYEEGAYGKLNVTRDGLRMAYWSSHDIPYHSEPDAGPAYIDLEAVDSKWLHKLVEAEVLEELVENVKTQLQDALKVRRERSDELGALSRQATTTIGSSIVQTSKKLAFSQVSEDWGKACRLVEMDPEGGVRQACVLVETTLKHILDDLGVSYAKTDKLQNLMKMVKDRLGQLDPNGSQDDALKRLFGGVSFLVQNVGSFRNNSGDAHGSSAGKRKPEKHEAQLAVHAAGAVTDFLLKALLNKKAREAQAT